MNTRTRANEAQQLTCYDVVVILIIHYCIIDLFGMNLYTTTIAVIITRT
jgi:hypothetical protein